MSDIENELQRPFKMNPNGVVRLPSKTTLVFKTTRPNSAPSQDISLANFCECVT